MSVIEDVKSARKAVAVAPSGQMKSVLRNSNSKGTLNLSPVKKITALVSNLAPYKAF